MIRLYELNAISAKMLFNTIGVKHKDGAYQQAKGLRKVFWST